MKKFMTLAVVATCVLGGAAAAKTVTYVETVTRADGSRVIITTTVREPSELKVTRASLVRSLLRMNMR